MSNILSHVVGGPCDNQVITIDDGRDVIYMCPPMEPNVTWRPNDEPPRLEVSSYRYKLTYFHIDRYRRIVGVWDGLSIDDAESAIAHRYS